MSERVVVLLRAVNLGATNKVPMKELRALCTELGATDVTTWIASGNVLCRPPGTAPAFLTALEAGLAERFGVSTGAVARTAGELRAALAANPYEDDDERMIHVTFLAEQPTRRARESLAGRDFGADSCTVIGREAYTHFANGSHASRISAATLDRVLGVAGTARNVRTVAKLADLLET